MQLLLCNYPITFTENKNETKTYYNIVITIHGTKNTYT